MSNELRMLLAIVLSFLVFFLYQVLFVKEPPQPPPSEEGAEQKELAQEQAPVAAEGAKPLEEALPSSEALAPSPASEGRTITVSTPLYVAEFTEYGGALRSFKLREYKETKLAILS